MKVLFCKVASMKFYNGITDDDKPKNGGKYVKETGDAHEKYNFTPCYIEGSDEPVCLGFFELKGNDDRINQLHIEKIVGGKANKCDEQEDDVLVIWCATRDIGMTRIVGWFRHATVYRHYKEIYFDDYCQSFNVIAKAKDCVMVPWTIRGKLDWFVPVARKDGYGFGQAMQWFADEPESRNYVNMIVDKIVNYVGVNDMLANNWDTTLD